MKKFLTLRNILLCGGALLTIAAFFVAFAAGLRQTIEGSTMDMQGLIIGKVVSIINGTRSEPEKPEFHATLSLIGIIMMLVAGLGAAAVGLFVKKPYAKYIVLGLAVVIIVGAVFVFLVKSSYVSSYKAYLIKEGAPAEAAEHEAELMKEYLKDAKLNAGTIFTAILGILGAGAISASQFIPEK